MEMDGGGGRGGETGGRVETEGGGGQAAGEEARDGQGEGAHVQVLDATYLLTSSLRIDF